MPNLKDIKGRIVSVKKTRQITQAMKLVAGAKLRKATEAAVSARPYQQKLADVLGRVAARVGENASDPLLQRREEVNRILVVVLTTDRGLCGAFNNTLLRRVHDFFERKRDKDGIPFDIRVYGRKGMEFLQAREWALQDVVLEWSKEERMGLVRALTQTLVGGFLDGTYDEVYLVYNEFINTITQKPLFKQVLPLSVKAAEEEDPSAGASLVDYRYEPSAEVLMSRLLPLFLRTLVLQAFLETEAGEYAARMTAMDNATRNASDLIDRLTLEYNRARQAAITTEITEIVSGAEAL